MFDQDLMRLATRIVKKHRSDSAVAQPLEDLIYRELKIFLARSSTRDKVVIAYRGEHEIWPVAETLPIDVVVLDTAVNSSQPIRVVRNFPVPDVQTLIERVHDAVAERIQYGSIDVQALNELLGVKVDKSEIPRVRVSKVKKSNNKKHRK